MKKGFSKKRSDVLLAASKGRGFDYLAHTAAHRIGSAHTATDGRDKPAGPSM
jgi:hypothetical protein